MSHNISGFIANCDQLRRVLRGQAHTRLVALPQGFAFVPSSDDMVGDLCQLLAQSPDAAGPQCDPPRDWDWDACPMLSPEEVRFARWLSQQCPIAWIETDYFGSGGFQSAAAWSHGAAVVGPLKADGAINQALRSLGVVCDKDSDEFDTLHLGWHRDNEEWLSAGEVP